MRLDLRAIYLSFSQQIWFPLNTADPYSHALGLFRTLSHICGTSGSDGGRRLFPRHVPSISTTLHAMVASVTTESGEGLSVVRSWSGSVSRQSIILFQYYQVLNRHVHTAVPVRPVQKICKRVFPAHRKSPGNFTIWTQGSCAL